MFEQKHNRRMPSNFPYFFEILIIKTKDIVYAHSREATWFNVDASVWKGGKLGGWGWLRLRSDAKLFSSCTLFEFRPTQIRQVLNIYFSSVLRITISLHDWFSCARNERVMFLLKSHDGLETAALLHQRCLIFPCFERKNYKSYYFNQKTKEHIWSGRLLAITRENSAKNLNYYHFL